MNLFLDDERTPKEFYDKYLKRLAHGFGVEYIQLEWVVVKNHKQFVDHITSNGLPDRISFDNDLQEKLEGKDCLKWVVNYCFDNEVPMPICKIHTANISTHGYMKDTIRNNTKYLLKYNN